MRRQTAGRTGVVGSAVALVRRLAVLPRIFERGLIRVSGFPDSSPDIAREVKRPCPLVWVGGPYSPLATDSRSFPYRA